MKRVRDVFLLKCHRISLYTRALCKWVLVSAIVGVLCGALGTAFHIGVDAANVFRYGHPWMIWTLPLSGLVIVAIYAFFSVRCCIWF